MTPEERLARKKRLDEITAEQAGLLAEAVFKQNLRENGLCDHMEDTVMKYDSVTSIETIRTSTGPLIQYGECSKCETKMQRFHFVDCWSEWEEVYES